MADEHFHEIQFSGKQLVFLFMATAVVAVVIFLTGVMVGRGARAAVENTAAGGVLEGPADSGPAPLVPASSPDAAAAAGRPPATGGPPAAASEEFSYYTQLQGAAPKAAAPARPRVTPEVEPSVSEAPPPAGAAAAAAGPPAAAPGRAPAAGGPPVEKSRASAAGRPPAAEPSANPPSGGGVPGASAGTGPAGSFSVQVAALVDRKVADGELSKLLAKGYPAYIVEPESGASPRFFRVRVGHFTTRTEADDMRRRLEKDQYKTLITR